MFLTNDDAPSSRQFDPSVVPQFPISPSVAALSAAVFDTLSACCCQPCWLSCSRPKHRLCRHLDRLLCPGIDHRRSIRLDHSFSSRLDYRPSTSLNCDLSRSLDLLFSRNLTHNLSHILDRSLPRSLVLIALFKFLYDVHLEGSAEFVAQLSLCSAHGHFTADDGVFREKRQYEADGESVYAKLLSYLSLPPTTSAISSIRRFLGMLMV